MIPYSQFHLTDANIEQLKKTNQRRDIVKYIKKYGHEPTTEIANTFLKATSEELEHERRILYMKLYYAEIHKDDITIPDNPDIPDNPNPGGNEGGDTPVNPDIPTPISDDEYYNMPFTIEVLSSGVIKWNLPQGSMKYSKNASEYSDLTSDIIVEEGDEVQFEGNIGTYSDSDYNWIASLGGGYRFKRSFPGIQCTCNFNVKGNILSLRYGSDYNLMQNPLPALMFSGLFGDCTTLISAEHLILPITNLTDYCYTYMFAGCTNLITPPVLPAPIIADYCYKGMFFNCTHLTSAPELPALVMENQCYCYMFRGCENLQTPPNLPSTSLANSCYESMFYGCLNLKSVPVLPASVVEDSCYCDMFKECTSIFSGPALPATELKGGCYKGMFEKCSSLIAPPALPATVLADGCYNSMFRDCISLISAPDLPATELKGGCYEIMFGGCSRITIAPDLPAKYLPERCYFSMFINCRNLKHIKILFNEASEWSYITNGTAYGLYRMLEGVSSDGICILSNDYSPDAFRESGLPSTWEIQFVDE